MSKIITYLDYVIYWSIVLIPFTISISPAPVNIFIGFLIASFLVKKIFKREWFLTDTAINIPLSLFFIATCISVLHTVSFKDSFRGGILRLLEYIFVLFIVAQEVKDLRHIRRTIFFMGLGAILASLDGVWQVWRGADFIRGYPPVFNLGLVRATASFKDSNVLGIYLSAITPLIFGLTLYYFKKMKRLAMLSVSIVVLSGIMLTYSRPTLLAIYVILFFFGIAMKDKRLILTLVIFTLIAPFILPRSVKEWAKTVEYNPLRFMCNDDRIAVYRNSLRMIEDHPIIGVGANTYMKNYKKYKEYPEYRNIVTLDYMYAHNNFLQMAGEIGLLGLSIFIWLLYELFRESIRIYRIQENGYTQLLVVSLAACLIAFLVNGLTESSLYYSRVAVVFWYLAGFLLATKKFGRA